MKKQIITLTATLALGAMVGCGRPKTDQIGVDSLIHGSTQINQFQSNKVFDSTVADATILTFPEGNDLDGYEYAYDEASLKTVMSRIDYGENVSPVYKKEQSSFEKIGQVRYAIGALGDLKDRSFEKLKQVQFGIKATEAKVQPMISGLLQSFPCYKLKENKRKCKLAADDTTEEAPQFSKKCGELKRNKKKYIELSEEQAKALEQGVVQCSALQGKISEITVLEGKVKAIREMGRNIGVGLVLDYSEHANFTGLVVVNSKEKQEGDFTSKIVFNETKTKIETISLGINFGDGYKEYSMENGGISKVNYGQTKTGTIFLDLTINGDYRIDAELTVSSRVIGLHPSGVAYTEVRLKGTTKNYFPNGKVRDGVMALQIDTLD